MAEFTLVEIQGWNKCCQKAREEDCCLADGGWGQISKMLNELKQGCLFIRWRTNISQRLWCSLYTMLKGTVNLKNYDRYQLKGILKGSPCWPNFHFWPQTVKNKKKGSSTVSFPNRGPVFRGRTLFPYWKTWFLEWGTQETGYVTTGIPTVLPLKYLCRIIKIDFPLFEIKIRTLEE